MGQCLPFLPGCPAVFRGLKTDRGQGRQETGQEGAGGVGIRLMSPPSPEVGGTGGEHGVEERGILAVGQLGEPAVESWRILVEGAVDLEVPAGREFGGLPEGVGNPEPCVERPDDFESGFVMGGMAGPEGRIRPPLAEIVDEDRVGHDGVLRFPGRGGEREKEMLSGIDLGMFPGVLGDAEQAVDFREEHPERAHLPERLDVAFRMVGGKRPPGFLPDPFGSKRGEFSALAHGLHETSGFRGEAEPQGMETGGKARHPEQAERVLDEGRRDVPEQAGFEIRPPAVRIDDLPAGSLGHGVDGEIPAGQVGDETHIGTGLESESAVAGSALPFGAGERVFLMGFGMQENGKIPADGPESPFDHRGRGGADHDVVPFSDGQAEQAVPDGTTDEIDFHHGLRIPAPVPRGRPGREPPSRAARSEISRNALAERFGGDAQHPESIGLGCGGRTGEGAKRAVVVEREGRAGHPLEEGTQKPGGSVGQAHDETGEVEGSCNGFHRVLQGERWGALEIQRADRYGCPIDQHPECPDDVRDVDRSERCLRAGHRKDPRSPLEQAGEALEEIIVRSVDHRRAHEDPVESRVPDPVLRLRLGTEVEAWGVGKLGPECAQVDEAGDGSLPGRLQKTVGEDAMHPGKAGFAAKPLVQDAYEVDHHGGSADGRAESRGFVNPGVRGRLEGGQDPEVPETGGIPGQDADPIAGIDEGRGEMAAHEAAATGQNDEGGLAHGPILASIPVSGRPFRIPKKAALAIGGNPAVLSEEGEPLDSGKGKEGDAAMPSQFRESRNDDLAPGREELAIPARLKAVPRPVGGLRARSSADVRRPAGDPSKPPLDSLLVYDPGRATRRFPVQPFVRNLHVLVPSRHFHAPAPDYPQ